MYIGNTKIRAYISHTSMLTFYCLLVTWRTNSFNIQQLYILSTLYLCTYRRTNKQLFSLYNIKLIGFYNDETVFGVRYELGF